MSRRELECRLVAFDFVTSYDAVVIPELSQVEWMEKPVGKRDFLAALARLAIPRADAAAAG